MKTPKILKWGLISLLSLILIGFLFGIYLNHFSARALKATESFENIKRISVGMTDIEVNKIMGKPEVILQPVPNRYNYTQYLYDTNDDSMGSIRVIFDSTMHVTEIYIPKTE